MRAAIEECRKNKHALSVLLLDVDNFKYFNDKFGHAAGDEILQEVVRLLRSCIRGNDRVCRLGGDEFTVVFYEPAGQREPGSRPMTDVMPVAMRFQQQIKEHRFPKLGASAPGPLSVSGGISTYPWDGATTAELLARADEFLLQSKREGKNRITIGHHPQA
jgi:diguanylate cyclase (GGDEF)-like protein